jgi:hypothetical protein
MFAELAADEVQNLEMKIAANPNLAPNAAMKLGDAKLGLLNQRFNTCMRQMPSNMSKITKTEKCEKQLTALEVLKLRQFKKTKKNADFQERLNQSAE